MERSGVKTHPSSPFPANPSFASLPWSQSVTGEDKDSLLYMPFLEWQQRHLHSLGNVKAVPLSPSVKYKRSDNKPAHVGESTYQTSKCKGTEPCQECGPAR